ncbi:MAG: 3-deoxy-8-phosphooctulonate synthase [Thermodesulfobacteriota bacterium]
MTDLHGTSKGVEVGRTCLGDGDKLFLVLGPCVIESESLAMEVATEVARLAGKTGLPMVFKSSYDKANRTSANSFRGPGIGQGLRILASVREATGLPVLSDIHAPDQAAQAGEVLDVIQIPAFLCRQTSLLIAAGETGKAVNIKKGQFMAPQDMRHAVEKVRSTGNKRILLTERGTFFGYHDLAVDMRSVVRMKDFGCPVIFDATHSAQLPGAGDGRSGGDRSLVAPLARAAVAAGADGVFMEVHPDPDRALCDGPNSLALADLEAVITNLAEIFRLVPRGEPLVQTCEESAHVPAPENALATALKRIKLIIFDVDGILTDGKIVFGGADLEIKSFQVRDGHGIKIAKRCGLEIALVTGRSSEVVARRAQDLGLDRVFQGMKDKRPALTALMEGLGLEPAEVAVLGDDIVDIPLMRRVGVAFTVPEAPTEVRGAATYVTRHRGGDGVAREIIEMILKAQGRWDKVMERYYA